MTSTTTNQSPAYPVCEHAIPDIADCAGNYQLRFARNADDLDQIAKLRFAVFNVELQEGLNESWQTCRDVDQFDPHCHHLMVVETTTDEIVGTYRMQTAEMARSGNGFYSDGEFILATLGDEFLDQAVELGRACVALNHRNSKVLFLLWRGLAAYMLHNQRRYFFGCCSLTSQDPVEGWHVLQHLRQRGLMHESLNVQPRPELACFEKDFNPGPPETRIRLPRLMRTYVDYGARIAGEPVIDRQFKTIDFLAVFDMNTISARAKRLFVD
ncbi:MAG: GNAT family N-acetyltransferase [Gammaproteobacteria bacterium]